MNKLLILAVWVIFFVQGALVLDPDFGWHLRFGQIIQSGIPKTDPFYTMPNWEYVDHEWSISLLFAKLYPAFQMPGLSVIFATFVCATVFLTFRQVSQRWRLVLGLLSIQVLLDFFGVRPQVISWFLFALQLEILKSRKQLLLLPLFLVWANIHAAFVLGLVVYGLWLIVNRQKLRSYALLLLSTLLTLVNPYGIGIWREFLSSATDSTLRFYIVEWLPIFTRVDSAFMLLTALSCFVVFKTYKQHSLFNLCLFVFLLIATITSQRNVVFWLIVALPMISLSLDLLASSLKKIKFAEKRFNTAYQILSILVIIGSAVSIFNHFNKIIKSHDNIYPTKAIEYLKSQHLEGEIFALYDWGGYLIWKLPEKKTFVDGRMPSWRKDGQSAFDDYRKLVYEDKHPAEIFNKHNVNYLLWPRPHTNQDQPTVTLNAVKGIKSYILRFTQDDKETKDITQKVKEWGWQEIYSDEIAIIYKRQ